MLPKCRVLQKKEKELSFSLCLVPKYIFYRFGLKFLQIQSRARVLAAGAILEMPVSARQH